MTKEMYVSSTPHETKVAVTEDDQLAEIFFERENEYTLAGSIYKGRVTRVLPGMQSAFVDIGLERDAFLYVSDFLDLEEEEEGEFDPVEITRPEVYVSRTPTEPAQPFDLARPPRETEAESGEGEEPSFSGEDLGEPESGEERVEGQPDRGFRGRRRRRVRRGRGFTEAKYDRPREDREREAPRAEPQNYPADADYPPIILPGESISKYQRPSSQASAPGIPVAEVPAAIQEEQALDEPEGLAEQEAAEEPIEAALSPEPESAQAEPETREAAPQIEPDEKASRAVDSSSFVLPGESLAKYHGERREEPRQPEPGAPPKKRFSHPLPEAVKAKPEPVIPEPTAETFHPFVLPGESISKYRGKPAPSAVSKAEREPAEPRPIEPRPIEPRPTGPTECKADETPRGEATFVIESDPWGVGDETDSQGPQQQAEQRERPPLMQKRAERERVVVDAPISEPMSVEEAIEEKAAEAAGPAEVQSEDRSPAEAKEAQSEASRETVQAPEPESPAERRYEEMNVASTFAGSESERDSDERAAGEADRFTEAEAEREMAQREHELAFETEAGVVSDTGEATQEATSEEDRESAPGFRHEFAPGEGDLEQEEIEGEEADVSHYLEDELEDYEELEEEHFEPMVARGQYDRDELTSAIEESDEEREAMAASFPEPEVEPEDEPEEEDGAPEDEEEELAGDKGNGRAEVRGPDSQAPYQQRMTRPAPFDRTRRGRRGGGGRRERGGAPPRREWSRPPVLISDLLKEGQEVLIQIAKEPIGKKGARITSHIALPGRFLVYMPTVNHIGVSRKINSDDERMRLKRIMISEREGGHGGFIVRTAAEGVGEDELRADIRFLKNLWAEIKQRSDTGKAPALIYHDLNLVERVLRDQVTSDFSQIWVDTESEYERILRFANRFQPALVRKVKLYTKETPLFEQFNIDEEINKSLGSKVWLKSGGYIVINQTEALVAIDVNTGKYVGKTARLEDTIVKTNVDAIKEIVRQIRLRDLGGIIVIDFIDMDERKNRQKVMQTLAEALKSDRAPSKVLAFNDFGLVAITRKRVKQSLERTLGAPCAYCAGTGFVKSVTTVCNEIYVEMKKMARHMERGDVLLRVNPEVAKALKDEGGRLLQDLEELTKRTVIVKTDPLLHQEQFDIH